LAELIFKSIHHEKAAMLVECFKIMPSEPDVKPFSLREKFIENKSLFMPLPFSLQSMPQLVE